MLCQTCWRSSKAWQLPQSNSIILILAVWPELPLIFQVTLPTSLPIAETIQTLLKDNLARVLRATLNLFAGTSSQPPGGQLLILGYLLSIHQTALETHQECEGLQPQLGPLPGQSLGDTEMIEGADKTLSEKEQALGSYFDSLGTEALSIDLQDVLQTLIRIGKPFRG